jgi:hypothetical protein
MSVVIRVLDGQDGDEKLVPVLAVEPVAAASTRRPQKIEGGPGCEHW